MSQNPCRKDWLLASLLVVGLLPAVLAAPPPADSVGEVATLASVAFVKADAAGANDGTSWQDAYTDLQDALTAAWNSAGAISQIWVATGTYEPPIWQDFDLPPGVALYGGFAGYEDDPGQRDPDARSTLKGNGSRVIYIGSESVVLDGFAIEDGNSEYDGGGIYCNNADPIIRNCNLTHNYGAFGGGIYCNNANPIIRNCSLTRNSGGGVGCHNSSPVISKCAFRENTGDGYGGAICMRSSNPNPTIIECTFEANTANWGGGIYCDNSSPSISKCVFRQNTANGYGGAIHISDSSQGPTITDCTFEQNTGREGGGGIYYDYSNPVIGNCIFAYNSAHGFGDGGAVYCNVVSATITNCEFCQNTAAGYGGAVFLGSNSGSTIMDCTFEQNSANLEPIPVGNSLPIIACGTRSAPQEVHG